MSVSGDYRSTLLGLCALVLFQTACSDEADTTADADSDVVAETDADPGSDTGLDTMPDAAPPSWQTPEGPHVLGDRGAATANPWAAPWPDLGRGRIELPNPNETPLVQQLVGLQGEKAGVSSGIIFPVSEAIDPASLPQTESDFLEPDSTVQIVLQGGGRDGERLVGRAGVLNLAGPHAPEHAIVVQPIQGKPWPADARVDVILTTGILTVDDENLARSGWSEDIGDNIAGVARIQTQDPTAEFRAVAEHVREENRMAPAWEQVPVQIENYDNYCVWQGSVRFTQFQQGVPPFDTGGAWEFDDAGLLANGPEVTSRVWFAVPKAAADENGWGIVQFVRVGGGGDRPLVDRGVRNSEGVAEPGTGLAVSFAAAGWVGMQFDGPHGGSRNPTRGDEQFLMFNITNPQALRDNIRQTALEVAVIGDWILENAPALACDGGEASVLNRERYALFGHSMGATVAPIAASAMPGLDMLLLSGAGGSWIENVLHKQRPLATRPIAEALLGYAAGTLREWDPVLNLLQAVGESADPQVYAPLLAQRDDLDVLMIQGIADTYILPPIANALSLPLGLTLGGDAIESAEPESAALPGYLDMGPWANPPQQPLPVMAPESGRLAVLVQHREDGIEDGHEVAFQLGEARRQLRCMLEARRVVEVGDEAEGCGE